MMTFKRIRELAPQEINDYLDKCEQTPQNPKWHPEAPNEKIPYNVLAHIKIVYNRSLLSEDMNLILAALFHDLGKADVTKINKSGNWGSYGHEFISANLVEKYKKWVGGMGGKWKKVHWIVKEHMRIKLIDQMKPAKQELLLNHEWINFLKKFTEYDNMKTLTQEEIYGINNK